MIMKTAISIPDQLFRTAEETASRLGIPRSQLYSLAIEEYINRHRQDDLTARLDVVYAVTPGGDEHAMAAGLETLRKTTADDTW